MRELDDIINHTGVKGMHWGVRHDEHKALNPKPKKSPGKVEKHLKSMKRERQWHKALKEVEHLTTKDIATVTKRITLENSLKTLSKSKMANKKDKEDYLHRHEMSNEELARKITRLQAKAALHKAVTEASKTQRETGIKIAKIGGSLGLKYALKKKTGLKVDLIDLIESVQNPSIKSKQDILDAGLNLASGKVKNPKANKALEAAKHIKFKTKS